MNAPQVKYRGPPIRAATVMLVTQSDFPGAQCTQPASALVMPWSSIRGDLKVLSDFFSAESMGSKLSATSRAMGSARSTGIVLCWQFLPTAFETLQRCYNRRLYLEHIIN